MVLNIAQAGWLAALMAPAPFNVPHKAYTNLFHIYLCSGLVHYQYNPGCSPASFISTLKIDANTQVRACTQSDWPIVQRAEYAKSLDFKCGGSAKAAALAVCHCDPVATPVHLHPVVQLATMIT